jgi:hypothetical protein
MTGAITMIHRAAELYDIRIQGRVEIRRIKFLFFFLREKKGGKKKERLNEE